MKLSEKVLLNARSFIYLNARLVDRRRFEYYFENGSQEAVLSALRAYQNGDGGFGNALEPDIRCPQSQPVPTEAALSIMDELGKFDPTIVENVVRYLGQIWIHNSGGFPRALKSLNDYPHAPWWITETDSSASMNPTGRIIGLLMKQQAAKSFLNDEWFLKTVEFIWDHIEQTNPADYHEVIQCITFLENNTDLSKKTKYLAMVDGWLQQTGVIERNPFAEGYVHKVLDWVPTPASYCAKFISDEEFEHHLAHLVSQQQEDGGWPMSWPEVSPAAQMEWRGSITLGRLMTLKSFGWL